MQVTDKMIEAALNEQFYPDPPCSLNEHYDEHIEAMRRSLQAALDLICEKLVSEMEDKIIITKKEPARAAPKLGKSLRDGQERRQGFLSGLITAQNIIKKTAAETLRGDHNGQK